VLLWAEAVLIFIPLLVHIAYGVRFLAKAGLRYQADLHHRGSHERYLMQRITAVVLLAFLVFHIATFHHWGLHSLSQATHWKVLDRYQTGGLFQPEGKAFESASAGIRSFWPGKAVDSPWNLAVVGLYFAGILAAVFHLANGVATGAEVLGKAPTAQSQARYWHSALAAAILLLIIGMDGWFVFGMGLHW
jgi:succinate dehydrogenase / fumarate reductase, cytochrome b subunit